MKLFFFLRMARHLKREMVAWKPDLVLTIDYTGMNLRLAEFAHNQGFRTCHYVCPQVWAWHRERIPKIGKILDQLLCFFPFEPDLFKDTPLRPTFIGHPLVDEIARTFAEPPPTLPWKGVHRIALLPGSRSSEIFHLLSRMLAAASLLEDKLEGESSFIIPTPTKKIRMYAEEIAQKAVRRPKNLTFVDGLARHVLRQADAAVVATGTASLEACMMKCPTVTVYASNRLNAFIVRRIVTGIRFLGLANIIADREVMPELLQEAFTPERTAEIVHRLITDKSYREANIRDLTETANRLGEGHAVERAADAILARFNGVESATEGGDRK
jgi:lipid-A-disaccharide synthase